MRYPFPMLTVTGIEAFGVLKGIDFTVDKGHALAVLGPSNAGKSLLLKILAGLRRPERGTVTWKAVDVTGQPHPQIGMTFQQGGLFDSWSVAENLQFAQDERGSGDFLGVSEALKSVGLGGTEKLRISELSGGMQKRLGLARAICLRPEVLLLDEPTAGLDPITSRSILELILELKKRFGMTLVLVTSDPVLAEAVADELLFLLGGKILAKGKFSSLRREGASEVVQFLSGSPEGPL